MILPNLGDTIETTIQNPYRHTIRCVLTTPEAVEFARKIVAAGRWTVVEKEAKR